MENSKNSNDNLISVSELIALVKSELKFIFVTALIFGALGILISLVLDNKYSASTVFIPQTSENMKLGGGIGGLASLAGVNLGGMMGSNDLPPSIYPKIISSLEFKLELLNKEIIFDDGSQKIKYIDYLDSVLNRKMYYRVVSVLGLSDDSFIPDNLGEIKALSEKEFRNIKRIEEQIYILPNDKEGFVTLTFTSLNPKVAAQLAQFSLEILQNDLINFKVKNAQAHFEFASERLEEKKEEFISVQNRLAVFRDRNQNLNTEFAQNQLLRLEAEYNIAFNVFNELALQVEESKIQVSKVTPVFSVIDKVSIPSRKSGPKRAFIVIGAFVLGFIFSIGYVLISNLISIKTS
ncbi:Wzz/FepE/Etk N-terminal domain-containing protein [Aquiflexum sp. TKW24L]|uniref:GNVR domain-containing protein n=1 Tax=Aquiflexum sp. TKW24L TaxID=2942212 RepID=UPI0020BF74C3|nr:GNVR domain-containing protein [Aquiflexum sp. TKW24L]MCL6260008.1 Wzz/FepE/Etk N-terminal domain-containing protein [Aquiflexum sp. TKW24L]